MDKTFEKNPALKNRQVYFSSNYYWTILYFDFRFGISAFTGRHSDKISYVLSMYLARSQCGGPYADLQRVAPMRSALKCYVLALMLGQTPILLFSPFQGCFVRHLFLRRRIINLNPLEDQKTGGVLMKLAVSVGVLSSILRWSDLYSKSFLKSETSNSLSNNISFGRNSDI